VRSPRQLKETIRARKIQSPGAWRLPASLWTFRSRLKGTEGDKLNAVLSAAGMNFAKLLAELGAFGS